MPEQGYKIARMLIGCFLLISLSSVAAVSAGVIAISDLRDMFASIADLAVAFGFQAIIAAYIVSRGKTSGGSE